MAKSLPLLLATCIGAAWSQYVNTPGGYISYTSELCNKTFADADGTGIYYYNPHISQGEGAGALNEADGTTLPISIAGTLVQGTNSSYTTQLSFWFSSNGANYTDDLDLGFDACALIPGPFSQQVNARGATDDGSCYTMFDEDCVNALQNDVANYAVELTLAPSVSSSLNASSLPGVCDQLNQRLNADLPQQCANYFKGLASIDTPATFAVSLPLTGPAKAYNPSCPINDTYSHVATLVAGNTSLAIYDQLAYTSVPILIVYMPVANGARSQFITQSKSHMLCAHIDDFKEGSRVPTPPSAESENSGLSKGTIAGIVIGVVLGLAVIAALAWIFFKRRQRKRNANPHHGNLVEADGTSGQVSQLADGRLSKAELNGGYYRMQELDARDQRPPQELDGQGYLVHELDGQNFRPRELSGSEKT